MHKSVSDLVEEGRDLSFHLYQEAEKAITSWAAVEAARFSCEPWRRSWQHVQPRNSSLGASHAHLVQACMRDALMTLGRMTDPPKKNQYSLFGVSKLLLDPRVQNALRPEALNEAEQFDHAVRWLEQRVGHFDTSLSAVDWREADIRQLSKRPYTVMKFRAELDRFRNSKLAHAGDGTRLGGLWLERFRLMTILCVYSAKQSLYVFRGADWKANGYFRQCFLAQIELHGSISIDYIHHSATPLVRRIWERNAKAKP